MSSTVYLFIADNDSILVKNENSNITIPAINAEDISKIKSEYISNIGECNGIPCYTIDNDNGFISTRPEYSYHKIRPLYEVLSEDLFRMAGKAAHIIHWSRNHAFCGKCGSPNNNDEKERAKRCPSCGNLVFPRIAPAIIAAVTRGNEILLAQGNRPGFNFYSVLAGFVEPGESLEECVAREIKEEAGIDIKNIRYFASQEWPFPDSLMIAFTAEYAGGELVIDTNELVKAGWFTKDNLPPIPGKLSVARKLIDWFVER